MTDKSVAGRGPHYLTTKSQEAGQGLINDELIRREAGTILDY